MLLIAREYHEKWYFSLFVNVVQIVLSTLLASVKYSTDHVQATSHGPHEVMESNECDPKQNMYLQL